MNIEIKLTEYLRDHRITRTFLGYDALQMVITRMLEDAPYNRVLLNTVAQKTGTTANQLYGRLESIKGRFVQNASKCEQERINRLDLYNFLGYLAHELVDVLGIKMKSS